MKLFVTTSWDDGHVLDLRLADLLNKYHIKGTFYIAPKDAELMPGERLTSQQIKRLSKNFEIGAHTMTHPLLTKLSSKKAEREMRSSKTYLEKLISQPIISFCYPRGDYNQTHVQLAKQIGFRQARTVKRFAFGFSDPLQMPTTIHAYRHYSDAWKILKVAGYRPFLALRYLLNWDQLAIALFEQAKKGGGTYHLWGHSWEIDDHSDWRRLERVLEYIHASGQFTACTNGQLAAALSPSESISNNEGV